MIKILLMIILVISMLILVLNKNYEKFTSSSDDFDKKVILITGGTRGIGLSIAKFFTKYNCDVVITGKSEDSVSKAIGKLNNFKKIDGIVMEFSDIKSIDEGLNTVYSKYKHIDLVINCAYMKPKRIDITLSEPMDFTKELNVNVNGPFYLNQKIIHKMRQRSKGGKIFFISSPSSKAQDTLTYKASDIISKSSIERMANLLAYENHTHKIGVSTIRIDSGVFNNNHIDTSSVKNKTLKNIYNKTNNYMSKLTNHPDDIVKIIFPVFKQDYHRINGKLFSSRMLEENNGDITSFVPSTHLNLKNNLYSTSKLSKYPTENDVYVNKQNPYGMSKKMEETLKNYDYSKQTKNIKSKTPKPLAMALSKKLGVSSDQLIFFKDEYNALKKILSTLIPKYDAMVSLYPLSERLHFITSELKIDVKFSVYKSKNGTLQPRYNHILNQITPKTKCVFLSNPNFLSGQCLQKDLFEKFLNKLPDNIIVIIDETFLDLVTEKCAFDSLKYLNENVLVLRGFSNSCGYENLELAYMIGSNKFMEIFEDNNVRFNQINKFHQDLALVYLNDTKYQEKILKKIRKSKETIYNDFDENDINYYKTDANFILMESTKSQEDIVKECETNNIIIEHENAFYDNYWSLPLSTEVINKRIVDIITSKF